MDGTSNSRGYLVHWDLPGAKQFVTWRLADSLPQSVLDQYRLDQSSEVPEVRKQAHRKVETALDLGHGSCLLSKGLAAHELVLTLFEEQLNRYRLLSFVIMPNHVHAILHIDSSSNLREAMKQIKGVSARRINAVAGRTGRLWQPEYFDRLIRDHEHFERTQSYIHWNPVKAGLCEAPERYTYSSANDLYERRILRPD